MKTKYFSLIVWAILLMLLPINKIEARNNNSSNLLELARNKYKKELLPLEEELIKKIEKGEEAVFSDSNQVNTKQTIRANFIEWLCTDRNASEFITYKGIQAKGAYIDGNLTLRYAKIKFPLNFIVSNFPMGINLEYANIRSLNLSGSFTTKIFADGLKVKSTLFMNKGFTCKGKINLNGATISGDMDCGGGNFLNPNGVSFIADGLRVEHKVLMNNGFESKGKVRFNGATIGIALDCSDAVFSNPNGDALIANGLRVDRSVYTPNYAEAEGIKMAKFHSKGIVSLIDGTIGGILDCRNGSFNNPKGDAFIGTGLKVERSVHMEQAEFKGELRLVSATIGGGIDCESSYFINPNRKAFNAPGIEVKGDLNMKNIEVSGGVDLSSALINRKFIWTNIILGKKVMLDLRGANIGILQDHINSWPDPNNSNQKLYLCGLIYKDIHEEASTNADERIEWLRAQDPNRFSPQPYEQLSTVLHNHGHYKDARQILINKNDDWLERSNSMPFYKRWGYWILGNTICYGYCPWNVHWYGLFIILLGCLLYTIGDKKGLIIKTKENNFRHLQAIINYPKFNSFIYSIDVFTPLIDLHQAKYWLPDPNLGSAGRWLRYFLWIQIALGWILVSLFLTSLSGLVKI